MSRFRGFNHDTQGFKIMAQDRFHHQVYLVVVLFSFTSYPKLFSFTSSSPRFPPVGIQQNPDGVILKTLPPHQKKTAAFVDCSCIWITPDPQDGEYVQTLTEKLPSIFSAKVPPVRVMRCQVSSDQFTQVL